MIPLRFSAKIGKFNGHMLFLKIFLEDISPFCGAIDTLVLDFKARVDPLLVCFITCLQWMIPQIHL